MTEAPSDRQLVELLSREGGIGEVVDLTRSPYRYATSAPLEEVKVETADGARRDLILKDLSRERLLGDAGKTKPEFLHLPEREVETYRRILAPEGVGPRFFGAEAGGQWLLIEKVPGVELWQVGELEVWEEVAQWLGGFHSRFAGRLEEVRSANPQLLDLSADWFRSWGNRARERLADSDDTRAPYLRNALERYEGEVDSLATLPRTFVHGELYPSNVLVVRGSPTRIFPVDWEMAAIGPGLVDLAALVGGWDEAEQTRLVGAYVRGGDDGDGRAEDAKSLEGNLTRCRLHLALQWLGWSTGWQPPPEHAHDWLGEALELADELGLVSGERF